jgi:hypothetical protein|tara:strand:+ start:4027 stop:4227 length:201 start_codon:yes stop_codon:yes gene_type:complete
MKPGDLIRVNTRHYDGGGDFQLGVIIAIVGGFVRDCEQTLVARLMMMDGSKVWLETKRLEVVNESR